jgi:hypothetical protein
MKMPTRLSLLRIWFLTLGICEGADEISGSKERNSCSDY